MGKRLSYSSEIRESAEELLCLERSQRLSLLRDRVRYIRLLKTGSALTQKAASEAIGLKIRQGQRNWQMYRSGGMDKLLSLPFRPGRPSKLSSKEEQEFKSRLKEDDIQFLHEAVSHVKDKYGQDFSVVGMHYLFKRLKVKKKTGRPVNIRQDKEGLEEFKKTTGS